MWNELTTDDQSGALEFYGELFGWTNNESMPMGDMGEYKLLFNQREAFGAIAPKFQEGTPTIWTYYFYVADINAAKEKTELKGGKILHGPHEVPSGDQIIIGLDPEGVIFALAGPK